MDTDIPVVILAGGLGLRMRGYSEQLPKALVPIGNMAVLQHVMKIYHHQGFKRFILCIGHKGDMIKDYFLNHHWRTNDFVFDMGGKKEIRSFAEDKDDFEITFADTGLKTQTGGRIHKIKKYVDNENFFVTYCDGVADINMQTLLKFHLEKKRIATLTAVHPASQYGIVETDNGIVKSFKEKPKLPGFVNGGFFVFNQKVFDYLNENSVLEEEPLRNLARDDQLAAYQHEGFWASMDTHKDVERLNTLWETGFWPSMGVNYDKVPWKIWKD